MSKCLKCGVDVNSVVFRCPLCNSELKDWHKDESIYPSKVNVLSHALVKKFLLLIVVLCSVAVLALNYFLTPDIRWSLFVVIQIIIIGAIISKIMIGKNKVLKFIFISSFVMCGISIFWDMYVGFNGWSLDYVLPSLCIIYSIFALILRIVNYLAFRENNSYIYFNVMLGFVPCVLMAFGYINFSLLAYLSGVFAFIDLLILLIFDWSDIKNFITKKLHI